MSVLTSFLERGVHNFPLHKCPLEQLNGQANIHVYGCNIKDMWVSEAMQDSARLSI